MSLLQVIAGSIHASEVLEIIYETKPDSKLPPPQIASIQDYNAVSLSKYRSKYSTLTSKKDTQPLPCLHLGLNIEEKSEQYQLIIYGQLYQLLFNRTVLLPKFYSTLLAVIACQC